jgi:hypothetical protein
MDYQARSRSELTYEVFVEKDIMVLMRDHDGYAIHQPVPSGSPSQS